MTDSEKTDFEVKAATVQTASATQMLYEAEDLTKESLNRVILSMKMQSATVSVIIAKSLNISTITLLQEKQQSDTDLSIIFIRH
ncbi:hypothetical protein PAAG_12594 [Paracoccidioides lutzii Pb01]|uniref:Uncharacterized protein n=1 Tax=Paracoccidioides lutzii (strain ATCC MYA-826 / Pb01) TaxID=502779 RepID=A0A0A2VIK2_PARBA|nr:hypothetical protein PAAG_12594 [Paracoccidioides lutzii Pb01]KGQ00739.1 hypothetical protein PAAG_12594 [Paracoccidioides lutzii Pb01]